jgi:hypothetical protein
MIISHKHKFVFIHNPKAAGSSIRKSLQHLHDHDYEFWEHKYVPLLGRVVDSAHLTLNEIAARYPQLSGYSFFVVVRDPVSRLVSSIKEYNKQHASSVFYSEKVDTTVLKDLTFTNIRFDWKYVHFCPQHFYFKPDKELKYYYRNLKAFKLENLLELKAKIEAVTDDTIETFDTNLNSSVSSLVDPNSLYEYLKDLYYADVRLLEKDYGYSVPVVYNTNHDTDYESINIRCCPHYKDFNPDIAAESTSAYIESHLPIKKIWIQIP